MKNFSKKNHSKNNSSSNFRRAQSKNNYKSNNFQEDKKEPSKNNSYGRNNFKKRDEFKKKEEFKDSNEFKKRDDFRGKEYKYLRANDKQRNSYNATQRRFSSKNSNSENYPENNKEKHQLNSKDKNFEDWIWGKHSVFAALNSDSPINRIWCTSEIFSSEKFFLLLKDHKSKGVLIEEVSWSRLSQLTYGAVHQGVALQLASSQTISLDKLIDISKSNSSNPIVVALDGITDPHNLGAIIRSAEAFDCKGIIIPQRRSAGLTGTVSKVAAGAIEHIPVCRVVNLNRAIDEFKKKGFIIIGLSGDGKFTISEFHEKAPFVVIVGAENKGISLLTQKKCDYMLKIPLKGKTSSLNASVAAAISLCYLANN